MGTFCRKCGKDVPYCVFKSALCMDCLLKEHEESVKRLETISKNVYNK